MQTQAEYIIGRFGGIRAMASALGHRNSSTVQGWKERGIIPARQQPPVLIAGAALGPPLEMREFFQTLDGQPHNASAEAAD